MPFTPTNFQNSPSSATPINAAALNKLGTQHALAVTDAVAQVATDVADAESAVGSALNATFVSQYVGAATGAATARLLGKLNRGTQDASILVVGDSTGNASDEWVYLSMVALGQKFPAYTISYYLWNDGATAYDSAITIQTGTGSKVLHVYNCSVSGKSTSYVLGSRWANAVANVTAPDLWIVSHGHNQGDPTPNANGGFQARWAYLGLTEELAQQHPQAGGMLVAQNPTTMSGRETWQATKADILQQIASQRGYGFLDAHQAFLDYAAANSVTVDSLLSDTIHPNATGSAIWAAVATAALTTGTGAANITQAPSALSQLGTSLIPDPEFSDWSASAPDGWALTNATAAQDTTNYETGTYGFQITAGGASGAAQAVYSGSPASLGIKGRVDGKWITVAARVYVPASYTGTPSLVISDNAGSGQQARSDIGSDTRGRFMWIIANKKIAATPTSIAITLAVRLSGTAAGSITVDRINVVEGLMPFATVKAAPEIPVPGTPPNQIDYLSTVGDNPFLMAAFVGGGAGVQTANQANLMPITPHRNMTVTRLDWYVHTTGGNYDIGIYDSSGVRLWSKGSTVMPASGSVVETVSPAVALTAGTDYYIAWANDGTTGLARGLASAFPELIKLANGVGSAHAVATSMPLPSTITPGTGQGARLIAVNVREA